MNNIKFSYYLDLPIIYICQITAKIANTKSSATPIANGNNSCQNDKSTTLRNASTINTTEIINPKGVNYLLLSYLVGMCPSRSNQSVAIAIASATSSISFPLAVHNSSILRS